MSPPGNPWGAGGKNLRIRDCGEEYIIKRVRKVFGGNSSPRVVLGIGDDTAVVAPPEKGLMLVTTDTMVEGVHFTQRTMTPGDLGWKSLAANVSDIGAMGGRSEFAVVSLGLSGGETAHAVDGIIAGMRKAAGKYGVEIIGGDTVRAPGISITVALWGRASRRGIIARSGAVLGDEIWVTGPLGGSHLGLMWMLKGKDPREKTAAGVVRMHRKPLPPADAMADLFDSIPLHGGCDLSDGLVVDLGHILEESGLGAIVVLDQLPVPSGAAEIGKKLGIDPYEAALYGGEDYEVVFTAAPKYADKISAFFRARKIKARRIGGMVERSKGFKVLGHSGPFTPDPKTAFQHFKK